MGVRPVIRALQEKSASVHEETLQSLFNRLPDLDEHERTVIRKLTKSMMNQMLHDPINRIKELAVEKQGNESLEMFSQIFALEDRLDDAAAKVEHSHALAMRMKGTAQKEKQASVSESAPASYAPVGL
ncbi:Glutamyl-tRNA reductase [compost metagenome]